MLLSCPACGERIRAKPPEPGRHRPRCPKCRAKSLLIVPADPRATFQIQRLPEAAPEDSKEEDAESETGT